jgi:TRAP-type C4-dicarboxylate transport system substrate-binding protein
MSKKWQILISVVTATIFLISLVPGCAPSTPGGEEPSGGKSTYHWRWADINPEDAPSVQADKRVIQEIKDKSDGRIVIDLYTGGALGDWIDNCGEVRRGTIEMTCVCLPTDYDPRINVVYCPLLTTSWEEAKAAYNSPDGWLFGLLNELMQGTGITLLGSFPDGFGCCSFAKQLPPSPMDPDVDKKMKMRVWPSKAAEMWSERMGYTPTPIAWAELFTAMQTGVVDTEVGGTPYLNWAHLRDVTKYLIYYADHMEAWFYMINKELYDGLSSEDQKIIADACAHEAAGRFEAAEAQDLEYLQKFRDLDACEQVIIPTAEEYAKMKEAIRADVWPQLYDVIGSDIMDYVIANA